MRPRKFDALCKTLINQEKNKVSDKTNFKLKDHFKGFQLIHLFILKMPQISEK